MTDTHKLIRLTDGAAAKLEECASLLNALAETIEQGDAFAATVVRRGQNFTKKGISEGFDRIFDELTAIQTYIAENSKNLHRRL